MRVLREGAVVGLANHTVLIGKDGVRRPIDDRRPANPATTKASSLASSSSFATLPTAALRSGSSKRASSVSA